MQKILRNPLASQPRSIKVGFLVSLSLCFFLGVLFGTFQQQAQLKPKDLITLKRTGGAAETKNLENTFSGTEETSLKQSSALGKEELFHKYQNVTRRTITYPVQDPPACWAKGCAMPGNLNALKPCSNDIATHWNKLGVASVDRYVTGYQPGLELYNQLTLNESATYFQLALEKDPLCESANINLGLVFLKLGETAKALLHLKKSTDNPRALVLRGFGYDFIDNLDKRNEYWQKAINLDPTIENEYFGVLLFDRRIIEYSRETELPTVLNYILYKEFSSVSFANYAQLDPETANNFVKNKYTILSRIIPPLPLSSIQKCYRDILELKILTFGDGQSDRWTAYNSRCSSLIHYLLTDLVRKAIAHNARPTYTYFGGYREGSFLEPHTDRFQCEFTFSLNIENYPADKPWILALDRKAIFEKDDEYGGENPLAMPPEERIVDAKLYAGDALLFMGRHLIHFRRGKLGVGMWTNQIFLHYVQENFDKDLG